MAYQSDKKHVNKPSSGLIENCARRTKYVMKLKNSTVTIFSENAAIKALDNIVLSDVAVSIIPNASPDKKIVIKAKRCELAPKRKRALLSGGILVKSIGFFAKTKRATIDWVNGTISGNSKIHGLKDNMEFTAAGFLMKTDGHVVLKRAKIAKKLK
jgi:hypothetical protein